MPKENLVNENRKVPREEVERELERKFGISLMRIERPLSRIIYYSRDRKGKNLVNENRKYVSVCASII